MKYLLTKFHRVVGGVRGWNVYFSKKVYSYLINIPNIVLLDVFFKTKPLTS